MVPETGRSIWLLCVCVCVCTWCQHTAASPKTDGRHHVKDDITTVRDDQHLVDMEGRGQTSVWEEENIHTVESRFYFTIKDKHVLSSCFIKSDSTFVLNQEVFISTWYLCQNEETQLCIFSNFRSMNTFLKNLVASWLQPDVLFWSLLL